MGGNITVLGRAKCARKLTYDIKATLLQLAFSLLSFRTQTRGIGKTGSEGNLPAPTCRVSRTDPRSS